MLLRTVWLDPAKALVIFAPRDIEPTSDDVARASAPTRYARNLRVENDTAYVSESWQAAVEFVCAEFFESRPVKMEILPVAHRVAIDGASGKTTFISDFAVLWSESIPLTIGASDNG